MFMFQVSVLKSLPFDKKRRLMQVLQIVSTPLECASCFLAYRRSIVCYGVLIQFVIMIQGGEKGTICGDR
jgi:hypothetical protein